MFFLFLITMLEISCKSIVKLTDKYIAINFHSKNTMKMNVKIHINIHLVVIYLTMISDVI